MEMTLQEPGNMEITSIEKSLKSDLKTIVNATMSLKQIETQLQKVRALDVMQRKEIFLREGCLLGKAKEQMLEEGKAPKDFYAWAKKQGYKEYTARDRIKVATKLVGLSVSKITKKTLLTKTGDKNISTYSDLRRPNEHKPRARDYIEPIDIEIQRVIGRAQTFKSNLPEVKDEKEIERLMKQIVSIGFKALSTKLHPDKGGTAEAFTRLKEAKDRLLDSI